MKIKIFIVIVNFKTYKDLSKCLKALSKQIGVSKYVIKTILIDCAYDRKEVEKLRKKYPQMLFILQDTSYGLSANLNNGFKKALSMGADYILMVTPDVYYQKNVLASLMKKMESNSKLGAITCKTLLPTKPPVIYFVGGKLDPIACSTIHPGYLEQDKGQYDSLQETEFLNCATVLIRATTFKKVGFWEPKYYLTYEDVDWTTRLQKAGYSITVDKEVFAWHDESSTVGKKSMQQYYYMARNQLLFIQRNMPLRRKFLAYVYITKKSIQLLPNAFSSKNAEYYTLLGRLDFILRRFGDKSIIG